MSTRHAAATSANKKRALHVKKGDTVMVLAGKDKGKTGTVKKVLVSRNKVIVEGINLVKKAMRPNPMLGQQGGHVQLEAPLHASNVMYYDVAQSKPLRKRPVQSK